MHWRNYFNHDGASLPFFSVGNFPRCRIFRCDLDGGLVGSGQFYASEKHGIINCQAQLIVAQTKDVQLKRRHGRKAQENVFRVLLACYCPFSRFIVLVDFPITVWITTFGWFFHLILQNLRSWSSRPLQKVLDIQHEVSGVSIPDVVLVEPTTGSISLVVVTSKKLGLRLMYGEIHYRIIATFHRSVIIVCL